jgi:cbb3-type cytochrome oxidase maturation protein
MSALFLLVIISITVAGFFLAAFIWSVKHNQFEDFNGASMRVLYDDEIQKNLFKK